MESKQLGCWTVEGWSSAIAWGQATVCAFALPAFILDNVINGWNIQSNDPEAYSKAVNILRWLTVIVIVRLCVGIIAGIILIRGVRESNPGKVKFWMILEVVLLVLTIINFFVGIITINYVFFSSILAIPIMIFFLWVVNSYRNELV